MDKVDVYLIKGNYYIRVKHPFITACSKCELNDSSASPQCTIYGCHLTTCLGWYYSRVQVDFTINRIYCEDNKYGIKNIIIPYKLLKGKKK